MPAKRQPPATPCDQVTAQVRQKIARLAAGGRPRVLDLFSGCGGLSLGFQAAGFELAAAVEIDPEAAASDEPGS